MLVLFLVLYTTAILATVTGVMIEALNDRYLAPVYIAAVLLFLAGLRSISPLDMKPTQAKKEIYSKLIRKGILAGICIGIWFSTGANNVLSRAQRMVKYGAGVTELLHHPPPKLLSSANRPKTIRLY